jgi:hypothetical protein
MDRFASSSQLVPLEVELAIVEHKARGTRFPVAAAAVNRVCVPPLAIWSLSVSEADLVTLLLDIENVGDQIGVRVGPGPLR